eukprot:m.55080 g.55080  ORF g.55080 m.55080 type:complete len:288 (-) comp7579_c0_seq3:1666-2529(-)
MGTKDALMLARLRTVRDREGDPTDPGATRVQLEPKTHRGRNTHGVTAAPNDGFSSLVEIRHETPVITPLAHAVQSGFNKVLGMVMHNDATVRDVGVTYIKRWLELDSMYLYIKISRDAPANEAVIYRAFLDAAYDKENDMVLIRHRKASTMGDGSRPPSMRTMRFRGLTDESHREWVRRLTGEEVPALEDSYVMVYRSLSHPGLTLDVPPVSQDVAGAANTAAGVASPHPHHPTTTPPPHHHDAVNPVGAAVAVETAGAADTAPPPYSCETGGARTEPDSQPPPYFS